MLRNPHHFKSIQPIFPGHLPLGSHCTRHWDYTNESEVSVLELEREVKGGRWGLNRVIKYYRF